MTAFAPTEEQQAFARRVRAIAAEELRPLAEAGPPGHANRELVKAMGQLGLLEHLYRGVRAPRIYEGASEVQRTIIARELYR